NYFTTKQISNSNVSITIKTDKDFDILVLFEFVSSFDIRISNFRFLSATTAIQRPKKGTSGSLPACAFVLLWPESSQF
ncbi:MAG: hypothetical protein R6U55_15770, partial [Desulfovermiculus sp.]